MQKIISFSMILQLLYHTSSVESLIGRNFISIQDGEFPFIATLQSFSNGRRFCGGALIAKRHVLTSAYCMEGKSLRSIRILFEIAQAEEPALSYTVASVMTYATWAKKRRIAHDEYGVAIITLTDRVYHINPVALSALTKVRLVGTEAKMIGWWNDILSKGTVKFLNDQDAERNIHVLFNETTEPDDGLLAISASPYALLESRDMGSPLLHPHDNSLLGIAFAFTPADHLVMRGNFSPEFIRQHQVNLYFSIYYSRLFIYSVIPAIVAA